jgi:hypothetical protein
MKPMRPVIPEPRAARQVRARIRRCDATFWYGSWSMPGSSAIPACANLPTRDPTPPRRAHIADARRARSGGDRVRAYVMRGGGATVGTGGDGRTCTPRARSQRGTRSGERARFAISGRVRRERRSGPRDRARLRAVRGVRTRGCGPAACAVARRLAGGSPRLPGDPRSGSAQRCRRPGTPSTNDLTPVTRSA